MCKFSEQPGLWKFAHGSFPTHWSRVAVRFTFGNTWHKSLMRAYQLYKIKGYNKDLVTLQEHTKLVKFTASVYWRSVGYCNFIVKHDLLWYGWLLSFAGWFDIHGLMWLSFCYAWSKQTWLNRCSNNIILVVFLRWPSVGYGSTGW